MQKQSRLKSIAKNVLRWGIAVVGIWYVLSNLSWFDYVLVANATTGLPEKVRLAAPADENAQEFKVYQFGPDGVRQVVTVPRSQLVVRPDYDKIAVRDGRELQALGRRVRADVARADKWPVVAMPPRGLWDRYWNNYPPDARAELIEPGDIVAPAKPPGLTYTIVEEGLLERIRSANKWMLLIAMAVYPIVYLLTTYRWWILMRIVEVRMSVRRTFAINMVGSFYNTFLLGSTGGDVLKAIYAARNTNHRTRAVVSVMVDRVIGLYGLIVLGGTIAGTMWLTTRNDPASHAVAEKCRQVAVGSIVLLVGSAVALAIYYVPALRKLFGVDFILARLPMQRHVRSIRETLDLYGRHPWLTLWTIVLSLPVHGIVVLSVSICCIAFGLPLTWWYYWVVVPITVLSGAIPISPQGAGVMEFFAFLLMKSQGATVTDVVTLTMSIRIIGILWNLTGGVFVLRGGYGQPKDPQHELEEDLEPDAPDETAAAIEAQP